MLRYIFLLQFLLFNLANANWHGGYTLTSSLNNAKSAIDNVIATRFPDVPHSTYQLLKVLRLRLSKHPDFVGRVDDFGWIRHDIVLFRQLKKNFKSQSKFFGQKEIEFAVNELESRYIEILKLKRSNVKEI